MKQVQLSMLLAAVVAFGLPQGGLAQSIRADFNGDGFEDLAVGVPQEDYGDTRDAGAVNVIYGAAEGLSGGFSSFWHQNITGIPDVAEEFEYFGSVLAAGDFNGDGFADLAIGVPFEGPGNAETGGAVHILYGTRFGLSRTGNQFWHQNVPGIGGGVEPEDQFGKALASGDYNGDGLDDLAVGSPGEKLGGKSEAGRVNVIYGTVNGLSALNQQGWNQGRPDVEGNLEARDEFGETLTSGDFDGNGFDDLAVGVPGEDVENTFFDDENAGAVNVIYGSSNGLTGQGNRHWTQDDPGVHGETEDYDRFGASLIAGDFDGDGLDDLAVGLPNEDLDDQNGAGAVIVLHGRWGGLEGRDDQIWHQKIPGIAGVVEDLDFFGSELAAGDFDGDGFDDLTVGVPGEAIGDRDAAGVVNVIYGTAGGLTADRDQMWSQDTRDVIGGAETYDRFGGALSVGDFDGNGFDDLAVGVNGEDVRGVNGAGAVNVLYSFQNLTSFNNQMLGQDTPNVAGAMEEYDHFGGAL